MQLNISIYENLMYKEPSSENKFEEKPLNKEKDNNKDELY